MSSVSKSEAVTHDTHQDSTEGISLLTDEIVLKNVHPSWANWPLALGLAGLLGLSVLGSLTELNFGAMVGQLLAIGLILGYVHYARKQSRYVVTDQRVIKNVGLIRNSSGETRIKDIRGLSTNQGLLERLFGKGSVMIDSTAAGGRLGIEGVKDYEQLANVIRERQRELED